MSWATRQKLPPTRVSITHHGEYQGSQSKWDYYVTIGFYDNGTPGEVFVKIAKQGSDISLLVDGWAICASLALQSGTPWDIIASKFTDFPIPHILQNIVSDITNVLAQETNIANVIQRAADNTGAHEPPEDVSLANKET